MPAPVAGPARRLAPWIVFLAMACAPDAPTVTGPEGPDAVFNKGRKPTPPPPPPPPAPIGTVDYDMTRGSLAGEGWVEVFAEDFTDPGLPAWDKWYGGAWNEELQLYQPENLSLGSEGLRIEVRRGDVVGPTNPYDETPKSFAYTSGRIESFDHFSASAATPEVRLSARLKVPAGYGMWPAFWSYGDPWPTQGEIDILEARGQELDRYQTAYWWGRREGVNQVRNSHVVIGPTLDLAASFHVYEVIWTRDALTFLFDGQVVDVKSGGYVPNLFGRSQRIVLNVAVGGVFFSNLDPARITPGTMEVDWVRVHTR